MIVAVRPLLGKLNQTTRSSLEAAAGLCLSRTHFDVEIEHLLLKLLESEGSDFERILAHFKVDKSHLTNELNRSLDRLKAGNGRNPAFSPYLLDAVSQAWLYGSIEHNAAQIRSGFVTVALLGDEQLSRLVGEFSREIQVIQIAELKKEFVAIVRGSAEDEAAPSSEALERPSLTGGTRVFVSYRRDDSAFYVDYLFASLLAEVPEVHVFQDSDTLKPGMVYPEKIDESVGACDILLAVIGKKWVGVQTKGGIRRIDHPDDWVRLEVAAALRQKKTVIPCLVGGARMPGKEELPADLEGLSVRHAVTLSQHDLRRDARVLMETLKAWRRH